MDRATYSIMWSPSLKKNLLLTYCVLLSVDLSTSSTSRLTLV